MRFRRWGGLLLVAIALGLGAYVYQIIPSPSAGGILTPITACEDGGLFADEDGYVRVFTGSDAFKVEAAPAAAPCGYTDADAIAAIEGAATLNLGGEVTVLAGTSPGLFVRNPAQTFRYGVIGSAIVADRSITIPLLIANDDFVFEDHIQTLANKTLTLPQIHDTSADHQYVFAVNELAADRTVTLPLLTGAATFAFIDFSQTWGAAQNFNSQALTNVNIDSGDISSATISGGLTWNAAQNLNSQNLTNVDIDSGTIGGVTADGDVRFNDNVLGTFGSADGTDADIFYNGTNLILDVNSGDLNVIIAGGDLAFQQATVVSALGNLTLSASAGNDVLIGDDATLLYVDGGQDGVGFFAAPTGDVIFFVGGSSSSGGSHQPILFNSTSLSTTVTDSGQIVAANVFIGTAQTAVTGALSASPFGMAINVLGPGILELTGGGGAAVVNVAGTVVRTPTLTLGGGSITNATTLLVEGAPAGASNNYAFQVFAGNSRFGGDINPEADGTRDLGTQTTAQWANVWSDLINGADYGYDNGWRTLEADTFLGYGPGIAFDFGPHFKTGEALAVAHVKVGTREETIIDENGNETIRIVDVYERQKVTDVARQPVFVVTSDYIEFRGRRITPEILDALLALAAAP